MSRSALTIKDVEAAKPRDTAYRLHDAKVPGLSLRVLPSGIKSWSVLWERNKERAIGKYPAVTLEAARARALEVLGEAHKHGAPLAVIEASKPAAGTVETACRDYVAALRTDGRLKAADNAASTFERAVYADRIGKLPLAKVSEDDLIDWRDRVERGDLADLPTKQGRRATAKPVAKSTVNRMRTTLFAALNRAVSRRKVAAERAIEWKSVKPHKSADNRRDLYLDRAQRRALLDNADADIRAVMECIILTGCRLGDPAAVLRRDYDARHAAVTFRTKDHTRTVPLSATAKALFDRLARSKLPDAPMFTNGGCAWHSYDWAPRVRAAADAAALPAGVVLYTLRHCWITDAIVGGMDLLTVAKLAGTSLVMIQKNYGHLVQDAARAKLATVEFL